MIEDSDKDILISVIAGSILLFLLCVFIVAFTMLYFKKKKQYQHEKEKLASEFAEILLKSKLEIKEQTLQNIAYELHDNLGHSASLIKIYLNTINLDNPKDIENKVFESKELVKQLIKDIKLLSLDLNSDRIIQHGINNALKMESERLNKTDTFSINFDVKGQEFDLSSSKVIILYRMYQEIINNIIKHSNASEVLIEVEFLENLFILVIKDNGIGFDITKNNSLGNGLTNLKSRAKIIDADLKIKSIIGKGSTFTIQISK